MTLNLSHKLTQLEKIIAETNLVAIIRQEPAEISEIHNLEFNESYDDLDYLVYTILLLSQGSQVSLVRHRHSPDSGLEICVRHDQTDIPNIISETLYELNLDCTDLTWVHPKYEKQLDNLKIKRGENLVMTGKIVERGPVINVGASSFKDPAHSSGLYIASFSLYQTYSVSRNKVKHICESLYEHLLEGASTQSLGDARFRLVTYREDLTGLSQVRNNDFDNQERTYIVLTRDTLRGTRATILVRFLTYGENLYLGVDTYVLGILNVRAFVLKILLTIIIPWFAIAPLSFLPGLNVLLWLLYLCLITFTWWGLIQRFRQTGDLGTALRLEFNKALDLGSFNLDDALMFIKSTLYTSVTSVRDVFQKEELPIESLDAFVQSINNININAGGSINMANAAIGVGNVVSSTTSGTKSNT